MSKMKRMLKLFFDAHAGDEKALQEIIDKGLEEDYNVWRLENEQKIKEIKRQNKEDNLARLD